MSADAIVAADALRAEMIRASQMFASLGYGHSVMTRVAGCRLAITRPRRGERYQLTLNDYPVAEWSVAQCVAVSLVLPAFLEEVVAEGESVLAQIRGALKVTREIVEGLPR